MTDDLISRQAAIQEAYGVLVDGEVYDVVQVETLYGLPSAQQWIPCSERLPEVNTRCLCTYENKEGTCIDFGLYMKRGWFVSGVLAWMSIPEPYKEGEG